MRAAYAEAQTAYLTGESGGNATVNLTKGAGTIAIANVVIKSSKVNDKWSDLASDLPFTAPADPGKSGKSTMTFTYDANGNITKVELSTPATA